LDAIFTRCCLSLPNKRNKRNKPSIREGKSCFDLKELPAKPVPALGYINGELRFWLGWAQEVAGDHAAAQESWRQARSELESFLKKQPENYQLIGDLALINMGLGDKAAAFKLIEQEMAVVPNRERRGRWSQLDRHPC